MTKKEYDTHPMTDVDMGEWVPNNLGGWSLYMHDEIESDINLSVEELETDYMSTRGANEQYEAQDEIEDADTEEIYYADENPLGIKWEHYYMIMEAKHLLHVNGYTALLGKENDKWLFRVYGMPYPEDDILGVPVRNIDTLVPKAV